MKMLGPNRLQLWTENGLCVCMGQGLPGTAISWHFRTLLRSFLLRVLRVAGVREPPSGLSGSDLQEEALERHVGEGPGLGGTRVFSLF